MTDTILAQQSATARLISWDRVAARLTRYSAIGQAFPRELLEKHRTTPPFFCHYMAWRLGTWEDETLFQRLDQLLALAARLPNWDSEKSVLANPDFGEFWSLVWQLQVAEYLTVAGTKVQWNASGPDLTATIGGQRLFVECCSHRKSFTLELFLEAMLSHVGPDVHLRHDWFLPLSLPHGSSRAEFLHRTLQPLFDEEYIGNLRDRARLRYPVVAGKGNSTLVVYVEGADVDCYDPSVLPQRAGDRDGYVAVILRETLSAKSERNHLRSHRPNLVAVSYLLSAEAQYALSAPSQAPAPVELGDNIDAIALSTIGIDEALSHSSLRLVAARTGEHPARKIAAERL